MKSIFFRPTPSKVRFSKFVMYSKPVISFISFPFSLSISNFLTCNKSSFVIGAFKFSLPKFSLLICCCKVLSRITFARSFCFSTIFCITVPLNLILLSVELVSSLNSYIFSPGLFHFINPLFRVAPSLFTLIF